MYTIIGNKHIRKWLDEHLSEFSRTTDNQYIYKMYSEKRFEIIIYNTNTITINGKIKNRIYEKLIEVCGENEVVGMDEVGVGDFFGPTVYCSVYLDEPSLNYIKTNHILIKDSKKFKNEELIIVYNKLKGNINYEYEEVYDYEIIDKKLNSIQQKMYFHNKNFLKYKNKEINIEELIIDLYTTEKNFQKRTKEMELDWGKNLILEIKADSKYISVALASIIARGIYLENIKNIEEKYNISIPLGTNEKVKNVAKEIINLYSTEDLYKICKVSFKTFNEVIKK